MRCKLGSSLSCRSPTNCITSHSTLKEYKRRFGLLLEQNDESLIPSDLRTSIYALSVKNGGVAEYEKALSIYRDPPTPSHKLSAMAALCATKDQELLKRTFAFIRTDEVKNQDLGQCSDAQV